jgi:hypothetical protein
MPRTWGVPASILSEDKASFAVNTTTNNISVGYIVHVTDGVAQLADATDDTKPAHAICVKSGRASTSGRHQTVKIETGITISNGDRLYLSKTTAGTVTNVAPSTPGNIIQIIGYARADGTATGGTVDAIVNINYDYTLI